VGWAQAGGPDPGQPVGGDDFPVAVAVVDLVVVAGAEQGQVGQVGGSAVGPGSGVVHVAVFAGGQAAGDEAAAVAGEQGAALGGAGVAGGAAQVEHGAVGVEQYPA
jgi:hypothetical protein